MHIVIVGSINMDLVMRVPRFPVPGESVIGREFRTFPGGKGANQAVGAARLCATVEASRVTLIGRVGRDQFGDRLLASLEADGVDITHVGRDDEAASGVAMITLDEVGENSIVVAPGANMSLTPAMVEAACTALGHVDALVMPLETPIECVLAAARLARRDAVRIILNPAPAAALPDELLPLIDVIVPNESETVFLTGIDPSTPERAQEAARTLQRRGVNHVVLTLGVQGAYLLEDGNAPMHLPAHKVEVVDTTAAGDAFVAGLAIGMSGGMNLIEAANLANAAAALAVTRLGAQPSLPHREEVDRFLDTHQA